MSVPESDDKNIIEPSKVILDSGVTRVSEVLTVGDELELVLLTWV